MTNQLDHIVIGATTLEAGGAALEQTLGVTVPNGSKHDAMSTHNRVMQIGNSAFFELIAIDPSAPDPGRARWFSLDNPATKAGLEGGPLPLTWVVNTPDLDSIVAASPIDLGEIVDFRRGDRTWRLTVPRDGSLIMGGLVPHFIEWSPGPHPSSTQADLGVRLKDISVRSKEPEHIAAIFEQLNIAHLAQICVGSSGVSFHLETHSGVFVLGE